MRDAGTRRVESLLCALILAGFAMALLIGSFLPVHSDEVLWRILFGRYPADGDLLINLLPGCGEAFLIPIPTSWVPWRVLDSWLYGGAGDPARIRWVGMLFFGLSLLCFHHLARRLAAANGLNSAHTGWRFWAYTLAPFSLGLFPFYFITNRPEQSLVLGLIAIVLGTAVLVMRPRRRLPNEVMLWIVFLVLASFLLAAHPKGVFFIGLLVFCGLKLFRSKWPRIGLLVAIALFTLDSIQYSRIRTSCPENPRVASKFAGAGIVGINSRSVGKKELLSTVAWNLLRYPEYLDTALFQEYLGNSWVRYPEDVTPDLTPADVVNILIRLVVYGLFVSLIVGRAVRGKANLLRPTKWSFQSQLAAVTMGTFIILAAVQRGKGYYESTLFYVAVLLSAILLVRARDFDALGSTFVGAKLVALATACLSLFFLIAHFGPFARTEWMRPGSPGGRSYLVSTVKFEEVRETTRDFARSCGLSVDRTMNSLVVDDMTYLVFQDRIFRPISTYFLWPKFLDARADPVKLLRQYHSAGAIARCELLPPALRSIARRRSVLCCITDL